MKKNLSIAIIAMTLAIAPFISCQKTEFVSKEEESLQLEAPSGQRIAATVQDLRAEASAIIVEKHGARKDFTVTGIEYFPLSKGYAAIISYQLDDGAAGNYAIVAGATFSIASEAIRTNIKKAKKISDASVLADDGANSKVTITCTKLGTCDCKIQGTINAQTGVITYKCNCGDQCETLIIIS